LTVGTKFQGLRMFFGWHCGQVKFNILHKKNAYLHSRNILYTKQDQENTEALLLKKNISTLVT
jgi:hypothetical protein